MKKLKLIILFALILTFIVQNSSTVSASNINKIVNTDKTNATTDGSDGITSKKAANTKGLADEKDGATREDAIVKILDTNPEDAPKPITVNKVYPKTPYTRDVNFSQKTLQGIFSSTELFFNIPDYWETKYIYVQIEYDVSQLIQSVASSMTFSVNNVPIQSCSVSYKNGNTQIAYVAIPMDLVKVGYNSFSISAYARLYDEEGCIDDFSGANWLSISENSFIRSGYDIKDTGNVISYYPYPFMSSTEETGKGLTIAVSDQATDGEVAAAMNIMADLSTETGSKNNIQFCLLSDLDRTKANRTIIVANRNNLPDKYKAKIKSTADLSQCATVDYVEDDNANPLLLITSTNDKCLLEAAYMLMDKDRVSQEKTNNAVVKLGSADVAVNSTTLSQMVAGNYTVKDIIGSGLTFVGPFHQEQNIYLPFSEDYFLSDAGKVTLNFRYSDNLDFNRSMITVYWGNIPIASKKLDRDKATGDELTFAMPADVVGTTAGSIRIAFDLEIKDLICTPRQDQMPWAYISDKSTLYLPASTGIVLTFDLKPSPFRTDGKFNDLMLVISDKPTSEELNLYAQIIGMYGDGVDPYGTFYVKRNSEFVESDSDYNIITTGTYANNKLIQTINDKLHFAYDESGTKFVSNEKLILSDTYASEIAILQLLESPFAKNRGVLAVTGATQNSLSKVYDFMSDKKKRMSLSKDCVVIDNELNTKEYQFINAIEEIKKPTLLGELSQNKQTILFTIISTSIMLMLLIAVIIILIRIRMYHRKNDDEN